MPDVQRSTLSLVMERAFAPRGIFITWADRYHYVRLSGAVQKAAAATTVLLVGWALFATTSTYLDKERIAAKEFQIARHEAAYADLARTVAKARDLRTGLEGRIANLAAALGRARADRMSLRTERVSLKDRVALLEQTIDDLRESERSVVARLSEQASEGVDSVEQVIAMTGLDPDSLVAGLASVNTVPLEGTDTGLAPAALGQGGPFLPIEDGIADPAPGADLASAISVIERRLDRWSALREVVRSLPLTAPLDQFRISSSYGQRRDPLTGRLARHLGIDFVAPFGTPVFATAPGVVAFAGRNGKYGRMIEIDHGYGIRTRYGHLRKILVHEGQEVTTHQTIGLLGSSGRSTGPHVHYEVRIKDRTLNPMRFILAGKHLYKS